MAALDFPDSPVTGDLYGASGMTWRWDGARWASTSGASGPRGRVAYAQIVANQGSITTTVDIVGLSVTFNADPSRTYRTTVHAEVYSSVAGDIPVMNIADAAGVGKTRSTRPMHAANGAETLDAVVVESGLSGVTTRKANVGRVVGTGAVTVSATPTWPAFILVEDITGEMGTSGNVPSTVVSASGEVNGVVGLAASTWNTVTFPASNVIENPAIINIENAGTRFVAKRAGDYLVCFNIMYNLATPAATTFFIEAQLKDQNSVSLIDTIGSLAQSYHSLTGTKVVSLPADGYVWLQIHPSGMSGVQLLGDLVARSYMQVSTL